ncbi:MAG: hypothetical protein KA369_04140 [Spirochaetes bacterium]|nr:hypothetical protein [Spirochaetota bacterium]
MALIGLSRDIIITVSISAILAIPPACRPETAAGDRSDMTARKALAISIEKFMKWKSYRYRGTSAMTVSGLPELSNTGSFDTRLAVNEDGAVDGHMVVESPGGSYETCVYRRITYHRLKGGEWSRSTGGVKDRGTGIVSLTSRRIIAAFADLVEDVRFVRVTDDEYVVTCTMGEKYNDGARRIAGGAAHRHEKAAPGAGAPPAKGSVMHLTIDRKTMELKRAWMKASQDTGTEAGTVTTVTDGTYTEINRPQDVKPPAEALNAPDTKQ